ncbi:zinc-finger double domain-containing protein [Ditylenchus destructor]|uniref:Zinc-finger double domain-containing protein n=1 Tax=Ditylenchus destructor TaxID=166010 RepID=A0AAD4R9Q6_9BILA|nr:zinc-finger double domain-containing protein [Ditylenchus destructor]
MPSTDNGSHCCCYICNECPKTFATLDELQGHMQCDHQPSKSQPDSGEIEMKAESQSDKNNEMTFEECSTTMESIEHPGEECGSAHIDEMEECGGGGNSPTSSDFSIDENMHEDLMTREAEANGNANGGSYPCMKCSRMFSDRDQLNIHYTHTHREKPQYVCDTCDKVFAIKRELSTHLRIHSGEQPHKCTQCGKEFGTRQLLKKHNMWHTGERSHVCSFCGKAFFQKGHLTQHLMIHKGGRPHRCRLCEKTFIFKFDLNRHMKIHAERGHACHKCGKCFPKETALEEHTLKCKGTSSRTNIPQACSPVSDASPSSRSDLHVSMCISPNSPTKFEHEPLSLYGTSTIKSEVPSSPLPTKFQPPIMAGSPFLTMFSAANTEEVSKMAAKLLSAQQPQNLASLIAQQNAITSNATFNSTLLNKSPGLLPNQCMIASQQLLNGQIHNQNMVQSHQQEKLLFHCFACGKEFANQAQYLLHWSSVHFRGTTNHVEDDVNNNNGNLGKQKQAEKELADTRRELERLREILQRLAGSVLNSPSCAPPPATELDKLWMLRAK